MRGDVSDWELSFPLSESPPLKHLPGDAAASSLRIDVPAQRPLDKARKIMRVGEPQVAPPCFALADIEVGADEIANMLAVDVECFCREEERLLDAPRPDLGPAEADDFFHLDEIELSLRLDGPVSVAELHFGTRVGVTHEPIYGRDASCAGSPRLLQRLCAGIRTRTGSGTTEARVGQRFEVGRAVPVDHERRWCRALNGLIVPSSSLELPELLCSAIRTLATARCAACGATCIHVRLDGQGRRCLAVPA